MMNYWLQKLTNVELLVFIDASHLDKYKVVQGLEITLPCTENFLQSNRILLNINNTISGI